MDLRLLVNVLGIWSHERPGMAKTDVVKVVAIVSQYQFGSGRRSLHFAIRRVENGMI